MLVWERSDNRKHLNCTRGMSVSDVRGVTRTEPGDPPPPISRDQGTEEMQMKGIGMLNEGQQAQGSHLWKGRQCFRKEQLRADNKKRLESWGTALPPSSAFTRPWLDLQCSVT